jgi:ATP-binding cassette subfamily A (ABC1) protein 3
MLPLYYMVTKLAEEKESKIRESMKMMGLSDGSYYSAWFLFNGLIGLVMALTIQFVLSLDVFVQSSFWVVLSMSLIYCLNIFGISFTLTSLIPNKKGSATAASIVHLATFCVNYSYKGYSTSFYQKALIACLMPNCAVGFMIDHLLHCEIEGGTGLTVETGLMPYQNFTFFYALGCQIVNVAVWGMVGIYFDKVMPREFGKAEPWNFICKFKRPNKVYEISEE